MKLQALDKKLQSEINLLLVKASSRNLFPDEAF